jgi:polyisoprenoid-binding protein YceI
MAIADGTYRLTPEFGKLLVTTGRTGMGRRAGHDLVIEATRWQGEVTVATAKPEDSAVSVVVDVDSLEVREGLGGVKPLTEKDRADIRKTLRDILGSETHPQVMFISTSVTRSVASVTVEGDLTIRGETQPVVIDAEITDDRVHGSATLAQTRWGIKPYSAFLGALKLADEVGVELDAALVPIGGDSGAGRS